MAANVKITHGTNELDLFTGEVDASVVYQVQDIRRPEMRGGSNSKTQNLPATGVNKTAFDHTHAAGADLTDALDIQDVNLYVDEILVHHGKGKLTETRKHRQEDSFALQIEGNNLMWAKELESKKLNELSLGTHEYSQTNVQDSWTDAYNVKNCVYYPVNYGEWSGIDFVRLEDLRPQIYLRAIFETIFSDLGWTIAGGFIDGALFSKLTWCFVGENFVQDQDYVDNLKFAATRNAVQPFSGSSTTTIVQNTESSDPAGNHSTVTGIYTASAAGEMKFKWSGTIEELSNEFVDITVRIVRDRSAALTTLAEFNTDVDPLTTRAITLDTGYWRIHKNDTVYVEFDPTTSVIGMQLQSGSSFTNNVTNRIIETADIDLASMIPAKYTQLWFVQQMAKLFNLRFNTHSIVREVFVKEFDNFFGTKATAYDWTKNIDRKVEYRDQFLGQSLKREQFFTYADDNKDGYMEFVNEQTGEPYGSFVYELPQRHARGRDTHKVDFAATLTMQDDKIADTGTVKIPRLWQDYLVGSDYPEQSWDFLPRILYYEGVDGAIDWNWYSDGNVQTGLPKAYFFDEDAGSDPQTSLSFANYTNNSGLFGNYWYRYYYTILNTRLRSCAVWLRNSFFVDIDLKSLVKIEDEDGVHFWCINRINKDFVRSESSKVEMFRLVTAGTKGGLTLNAIDPPLIRDNTDSPFGGSAPAGGSPNGRFAGFETEAGSDYSLRGIVIRNGSGNYAGEGALAAGIGTRALRQGSLAIGEYNEEDADNLLSIGDGTEGSRRNALNLRKVMDEVNVLETNNGLGVDTGSVNCIPVNKTLYIPSTSQHVVFGTMKINGRLALDGQLIVKPL